MKHLLAATLGMVASALAAPDDYDFTKMIQPAPISAKFEDPDHIVWCGTAVRDDQGKYHMLYSRWPSELGHYAWVTHSEVAHAVADNPLGPYKFTGVALPARGKEYWDGLCTHNPNVVKFGNKYFLYYMGNTGDGKATKGSLNWSHRNNQRIGVAIADSPAGPWTRADTPLIAPTPGFNDAQCLANPSVTQRPDGSYLMVYKAIGDKGKQPFGGSGANRTVTLTPAPDQTGNATITLNVSDGTFTTSTTFVLTVGGIRVVASAARGITTQTGATNTLTNFTVAPGNHRKLVLAASWENGSASINATWNGTENFTVATNSGGGRNAAILYLDNPTPGTGNIVVTFGGNTGSRVGVVSLVGVAGGVAATSTATGTSGRLATLVDGSWIIGVYTSNDWPTMTGPFPTTLYNGDSGSSSGNAGHRIVPNSGPGTYPWTVSAPLADNNALATFVPMTAAPLLLANTPATDATNVSVDANLIAAFSETITVGIGTITLWRVGGIEPVETFDVSSSPRLNFSGQTLTIDPTANLAPGRSHYILIDSGAIIDTSGGDALAGISDPTAWNFTTAGTPVETFAEWIANPDFGIESEDQDLSYDADGDGIANGVENFFGTHPGIPTQGLVAGTKNGNTFTFTHPQNATPASDLTASYQWSKDLANFLADGATDETLTKVDFTTQLNNPSPGTTTVTATVTGTALGKLFVRVNVTQPCTGSQPTQKLF